MAVNTAPGSPVAPSRPPRPDLRLAAALHTSGSAVWAYATALCPHAATEAVTAALATTVRRRAADSSAVADEARHQLADAVRGEVVRRLPSAGPGCPAPSELAALSLRRAPLPRDQRAALAEHLAGCTACAALARRIADAEPLLCARPRTGTPKWMYAVLADPAASPPVAEPPVRQLEAPSIAITNDPGSRRADRTHADARPGDPPPRARRRSGRPTPRRAAVALVGALAAAAVVLTQFSATPRPAVTTTVPRAADTAPRSVVPAAAVQREAWRARLQNRRQAAIRREQARREARAARARRRERQPSPARSAPATAGTPAVTPAVTPPPTAPVTPPPPSPAPPAGQGRPQAQKPPPPASKPGPEPQKPKPVPAPADEEPGRQPTDDFEP